MRFGSAYFPVARCRRALLGIFRFVICVEELGNRVQYKVQYTVDSLPCCKIICVRMGGGLADGGLQPLQITQQRNSLVLLDNIFLKQTLQLMIICLFF